MGEQNIYIILTDTGTIFTRLIKLYTRKSYNHASISLESHLDKTYSFGRKSDGNPFIGGFIKEDTQGGLFKTADCAIYSCTVTKIQLEEMKQYIQNIEANKHLYKYNFLGLFAVVLNKQIKRENAFFCSQFVATILDSCDILHFDKPLMLVTPYDLQTMRQFKLVYQGKLSEFLNGQEIDRNIDIESSMVI